MVLNHIYLVLIKYDIDIYLRRAICIIFETRINVKSFLNRLKIKYEIVILCEQVII